MYQISDDDFKKVIDAVYVLKIYRADYADKVNDYKCRLNLLRECEKLTALYGRLERKYYRRTKKWH